MTILSGSVGGSVSDPMDQKVTHLVHAGIDDPDIPVEGRKVAAARRWKIPIVGMGQIREMARVAAEEEEVAEAQEELARKTAKGKGRAILSELDSSVCKLRGRFAATGITNKRYLIAVPVTFDTPLTTIPPSPEFTDVLSECVIFITKQCEVSYRAFHLIKPTLMLHFSRSIVKTLAPLSTIWGV